MFWKSKLSQSRDSTVYSGRVESREGEVCDAAVRSQLRPRVNVGSDPAVMFSVDIPTCWYDDGCHGELHQHIKGQVLEVTVDFTWGSPRSEPLSGCCPGSRLCIILPTVAVQVYYVPRHNK